MSEAFDRALEGVGPGLKTLREVPKEVIFQTVHELSRLGRLPENCMTNHGAMLMAAGALLGWAWGGLIIANPSPTNRMEEEARSN